MAVENNLRQPVRPDIVGETLNYIFTTKDPYKKLTNIPQKERSEIEQVRDAIRRVYAEYFRIRPSYVPADLTTTTHLRGGDIIIGEAAYDPIYVVTFVHRDNFTTWPRLSPDDPGKIKGLGIKRYKIFRPNLDAQANRAIAAIKEIAKEAIENDPDLSARLKGDNQTIRIGDDDSLRDGALQIGDMVFLVDPTQISFMTQNGYQFFPTVRTAGNPKIPTIDQIKNISISLIFPNQDSINYQLMNLVAMYKRAPFVNIRNKDICSFFQDITVGGKTWPNQWLSVGLESIHIQSIDGFPNTVQAQITMLPFDSRQITPGFEALRSMKDVSIQQSLLYNNGDLNNLIRISESKLDEQSIMSERFLDVVPHAIDKDHDFRRSIPFRAYYQSVINDRRYITDEYGTPVKAGGENIEGSKEYPIEKFRPQRPENRLYHYDADANSREVNFTYSYIPGDRHEINRLLSETREKEQTKILENLTRLKAVLEKPEDVLREVVTSFHTIDDAFQEINHRWRRANRLLPDLLAQQGITLDSEYENRDARPPIKGLFDLLFRGALQRFGIEQSWNFIKDGRELVEGKFDADATDYLGLLKGLVYYGTDRGLDNEGSVVTAQKFIDQITAWLNPDNNAQGEQRKEQFAAFLTNLRAELFSEYFLLEGDSRNRLQVIVDPTGGAASPFRVSRIPLKQETVTIDNLTDVITSWSIVFANKFVPITLQAFKYPYYQHMGSEDAVLSLRIKALEGSILKDQLSLLSERLYESNKILNLTAPELITYMDGRVTVDCPINHMFRAFGVYKVVYNNSTATSNPINPSSWDIDVSMTQANFTIEQYHKIEHVPTNVAIKNELAKMLARIEVVKTGENDPGKLVVKAYKQKVDPNNLDPIYGSISTVNQDKSQLIDIDDMATIVRLRFLLSRHGNTLSAHIDKINALAREQARRKARRERRYYEALNAHSIANMGGEIVDTSKLPPVEAEEVAVDLDKEIAYFKGMTSKYETRMSEIINKTLFVYTDEAATNALQTVLKEYPLFEKILRFVINRFDGVLETQTRALINLIQLDTRNYMEVLLGIDRDLVAQGKGLGAKAGGSAVLAALAFATKTVVGKVVGVIGVAHTLFQLGDAYVQTKASQGRKVLVDKFDSFFLRILDDFNSSALQQLGNQIYRDPVVRSKFTKAGIITENTAASLREQESRLVVNCYNDFDIPNLPEENYSLSPDFYIYNKMVDRTEADSYVQEAMKRHARIGKMTALMTLQENMDVLDRFESILNQTVDLQTDPQEKVLTGTTAVLLDGKAAASVDDAKENIQQVRLDIEAQFVQISRATKKMEDGVLTGEQYGGLLKTFREVDPEPDSSDKRAHKEWLERYNKFKENLSVNKRNVNLDEKKLNLLYSARVQVLLRLFERYVALNQYMEKKVAGKSGLKQIATDIGGVGTKDASGKNIIDRVINRNNTNLDFLTKSGSDVKAASDMYSQLAYVLEHASDMTSANLNNSKRDEAKILKKRLAKGRPNTDDENYVSLPAIRNLQIGLYNDISFYIRLNTFLTDFAEFGGRVTLDAFPELKMLDYFNFQQREALTRRNELLQEFWETYRTRNHSSIRMFPTFKLYFIEEDKGIWRSNDDYYAHNAIQSIEIAASKSSAGQTAVVRLSNVTNTVTNRLSFHREASDVLLQNNGNAQDAFFGTLDVKPGTPVMIKMGYAPNDKYLDTLFVGRIVEMSAGPVVELICQSYGSQLNHHIVAEHFGLLATRVREHGDVAAALLDTIPGLEKLGKIPMFGLVTGDFSGKNLRNIRGKVGDRFLLGNLLGSVTALSFSQDNPRDENIYLPFSMVPEALHRPTFDWIVYDQSVWEALDELSLYNRNVRPMVRIYNNDAISFDNEVRETLVMGDKAGYYKYTDALSLSTLNIREIDRARHQWNKIKLAVQRIITTGGYRSTAAADGFYLRLFRKDTRRYTSLYSSAAVSDLYLNSAQFSSIYEIWEYMQNRTNALLLVASVLDKVPIVKDTDLNIGSFIQQFFQSQDILAQNRGLARFVNNLLRFANITDYSRVEITEKHGIAVETESGPGPRTSWNLDEPAEAFAEALLGLAELQDKYRDIDLLTIADESYYNIKSQVTNTSEQVASDPRYRKIQQHHLISDMRDIISNNVALNAQFPNAVHLYYTGEPKIKNASIDDVREGIVNRTVNLWTMKAFGDIKDEHLRILNSYQKNIDTNWVEISTSTHKFFRGYNKLKLDNGEVPSKANEMFNGLAGFGKRDNKANIDIPRWDLFPAFVVVALSLLLRETEKMYQGSIELVGNPKIKPYDIIHLEDYTNDMHGAVEVEEVVHTFTPDGGFRTVVTPNLITYDRDPMQMQDVGIVNNMAQYANDNALKDAAVTAVAATATAVGWIGGPLTGVPTSLVTVPILWNSTVGGVSRYHKFLYDQLGQAIGRDCINFTSLIYHGVPYMAGFDGVDYTSLKTLINHKVQDIQNPIARLAAFSDPLMANISTNFRPAEYGPFTALANYLLPGSLWGKGYPKNTNFNANYYSLF